MRMPSGVLGYVPAVLPRMEEGDWDEPESLAPWFSRLPACRLLGRRHELLRSSRFLSPDFFYVLNLIFLEWPGFFGSREEQIFPGLRVPLPQPVIARALDDCVYFERLSDVYFGVFAPVSALDDSAMDNPAGLAGYAMARVLDFVPGVICETAISSRPGVCWRFGRKGGLRFEYYHFDESRARMECVGEEDLSWVPGDLYKGLSLFFPKLWGSSFFETLKSRHIKAS
jgi:hypothetical protein